MRRSIVILLAVLLFIITIPGCSSSGVNTNNPNPDVNNKKEVTLTFFFYDAPDTNIQDIFNQVQIKAKARLNIKLDFKLIRQLEYDTQLQNALDADLPCDVFYVGSNLSKFIKNGEIMDITKLLPKYAPGYYKMLGKDLIKGCSYNGKL